MAESTQRTRLPFAVLAAWLVVGVAARAQDAAFARADTLVGKSVTVLNVYRSGDGVTITRLKNDRDLEAAKDALQAALKKYPATFIARVLETVCVGSELRQVVRGERKEWGGLYRYGDKTMFLKYMGDARRFETVFHHELAHGIHLNFCQHFDAQRWLSANPEGFEYTHEIDQSPMTAKCLEAGFVRPYAMFSIEEDVACLAECLIGNPESFARGVGRYGRINRKACVLAALYQAVDPVMTVQYFTFEESCAAVLRLEDACVADRVRFEFLIDRSEKQ